MGVVRSTTAVVDDVINPFYISFLIKFIGDIYIYIYNSTHNNHHLSRAIGIYCIHAFFETEIYKSQNIRHRSIEI